MSTYPVSIEQAFSACLTAAKECYFSVVQVTPPFLLQMRANKSLKSWDGVIVVNLTEREDGCYIGIDGDIDGGGMLAKAEAMGALSTRTREFTKKLESAIESIPAVVRKSAIDDDLEQLSRLKEMLASGEIAQDEFDLLKKKLLG